AGFSSLCSLIAVNWSAQPWKSPPVDAVYPVFAADSASDGSRRESTTDLFAGAGPTCSFGPELGVVVAGGGVRDRIPTLRRLHVAVLVGRTNGQCVRTGLHL